MTPKDPYFTVFKKFEIVFPKEIYFEKKLPKIFENFSKKNKLKTPPRSLETEDIISYLTPNKRYEVFLFRIQQTIFCTYGWEKLLKEGMLPINFSELFFLLKHLPLDTGIFIPNRPEALPPLLDGISGNDKVAPVLIQNNNSVEILCFDLYNDSILGESSSNEKNIIIGLKEL